jgi:hypothetical protein
MLPTLPDFGHGTRLAALLNGEKKAFSFSPRWSEDEARRIQRPTSRVKTQQRRVNGRCTDSGPSTFSTDYLVICGRASARSLDAENATLESPLDSAKRIIAQLLCPVQRSLTQGFQLTHLCPQTRGSEGNRLDYKSYAEPLWREVRKAAPTSGGLVFVAILNP